MAHERGNEKETVVKLSAEVVPIGCTRDNCLFFVRNEPKERQGRQQRNDECQVAICWMSRGFEASEKRKGSGESAGREN